MTPTVADIFGKIPVIGNSVAFVSGNYSDMQLYIGYIHSIHEGGVIIHPKGSFRPSGMFLIINNEDKE